MASLEAYGKVLNGAADDDDHERQEAGRMRRTRKKKRVTIIALSSITLFGIVVAAVVFGGTSSSSSSSSSAGSATQSQSLSSSIKATCDVTLYPDSCYRSLEPLLFNLSKSQFLQPEQLFKLSIQVAMNELSRASQQYFSDQNYGGGGGGGGGILFKGITVGNMSVAAAALESCRELLGLALDHLNSSILSSTANPTLFEALDDLKTWLSSAGTYQQTCIDGFDQDALKSAGVFKYLQNSTEFTSNSLAIIDEFSKLANSLKLRRQRRRRLMSLTHGDMPHWLSPNDRRRLLHNTTSRKIKADAVVANDGSGNYKSINAALKAVPDESKKRFVIYVKKGVYNENVRVEKSKWNVMMIGDGMDATVVSGSLNFVDGTPTFQTATFAVFGMGFIAREMGFRNTAGAIKQQAVALMSTSDQSVFYRCRIDAFQDTLYAHSNRQFYRECDIHGTVDFIFGNSAVVIQNSNILPKVPMPGQQNTITAQGKIDPNQNTGISIQNCTIWPSIGNFSSFQTFLGRPWKNYSTTVYMHSVMGGLIDPKGWLPWIGNTAPPDTIFYAEFQNFGSGSSTKNRVKWKGLRNISNKQATKFTVRSFIDGNKWLPATGISYRPGL